MPKPLRALLLLAAFGWGLYILLQFRTQDVGFQPRPLLFTAAIFVLPASLLASPMTSARRWLGTGVGLTLACMLLSELVAGLEESWFVASAKEAPPMMNPMVKERWWPFGHHGLIYHRDLDQLYGHD